MIIKDQNDITPAVLAEVQRAKDPRTRELLSALVRHLHAFVREVNLTEKEFREGTALIAEMGRLSNESHNEVVLMSGSLGLSLLVCLLNNGENGKYETTANMLGPFWRVDSPRTENGASIIRSPTPGPPVLVTACVKDRGGNPIVGAEVDVWQSSTEGFYENQDPGQAEMNLRGKFTTDEQGSIRFRSIKPAGYPIPVNGPVGLLVNALGRANMRPAHIHFLIYKEGYKTHISQVYVNDDPNLETDVQFGVTQALVGNYVPHQDEQGLWYTLEQTFVMDRGEAVLPRPPISGKAEGDRPVLTVLDRK
jgi:hydroxyquinol 1,2-dioxygenase